MLGERGSLPAYTLLSEKQMWGGGRGGAAHGHLLLTQVGTGQLTVGKDLESNSEGSGPTTLVHWLCPEASGVRTGTLTFHRYVSADAKGHRVPQGKDGLGRSACGPFRPQLEPQTSKGGPRTRCSCPGGPSPVLWSL